jgi:hypothetical protein
MKINISKNLFLFNIRLNKLISIFKSFSKKKKVQKIV